MIVALVLILIILQILALFATIPNNTLQQFHFQNLSKISLRLLFNQIQLIWILEQQNINYQLLVLRQLHLQSKFFVQQHLIEPSKFNLSGLKQMIKEYKLSMHLIFASKTYQHENANALTGILSQTSISYNGPLEFELSISGITKTSVTVDISNPSGKLGNLKQIGYQIVLGTEEVFDILGLQQVTTSSYNSANFNLQANKWLLTPMIGYNYPNNFYLQYRWSFTITSTTISYKVDCWGQLVKHTHQRLWMSYAFNTIYQPLVSQTIRISQKFDLQAPSRPTVYSKSPQTNEIFDQIGTFTTIIDKSIQPVLMEIIMKCSSGKKIKSQFNKCNSCPTQRFNTFNHQCNNQINQISYFPRYVTGVVAHQELMIIVSVSRIVMKQITYNQLKTETTILDIQILDV